MRDGWARCKAELPDYGVHIPRTVALDNVMILIGRTAGSPVPPEIQVGETVIWTSKA